MVRQIRPTPVRAAAMVLALASFLLTVACSNPHNLKITDANKDSFMDQLKDSKGLTVEEIGLLMSFQIRRGASRVLGSSEVPIVGKTVGELIRDERKFQADA